MLPILMAITMAATSCLPIGQSSSKSEATGPLLRDLEIQPCPRLGIAFPGGDPSYFHLVSEGGMGVARLSVSWSKYEPQDGVFDWYSLDRNVVTLQQLGIEPFLTMETDAPWGVESTTKIAKNRPPLDLSIWKRFVKTLVERYDADGRNDAPGLLRPVRYYQAFNEWLSDKNKSGGWTGTTDQLIETVNATYDAVKASDSSAHFVMGGIASVNVDLMALREGLGSYTIHYNYNETSGITITPGDAQAPQYQVPFDNAYRVLRECRFDFADIHLYGPVEFDAARIPLIEGKCPKRRVLSSEFGGPSRDYDDNITPEDHFNAVIQYNLDILSRGLEFGLWFRLGENPDGTTWGNVVVPLFDTSGQPKAGYWAYMLLAAVLQDLDRVQRIDSGAYIVHRKKGRPLLVAWSTPSRSTLSIPQALNATQVLRVTNAQDGGYSIEAVPGSGVLTLGGLPVVAGASLPGASQGQ
jgi:hypothetical protein